MTAPGIHVFGVRHLSPGGAWHLRATLDAFAPLHAMPAWMQVVAHLNPLTYAIDAMRHLVIDGWPAAMLTDMLALAAFALACLVIGTAAFHRHRV